MKTPRLIALAALSVAALMPAGGARTVQTPAAPDGYRYCPYSSSALSTSGSSPGGNCSTTSSTPSSA